MVVTWVERSDSVTEGGSRARRQHQRPRQRFVRVHHKLSWAFGLAVDRDVTRAKRFICHCRSSFRATCCADSSAETPRSRSSAIPRQRQRRCSALERTISFVRLYTRSVDEGKSRLKIIHVKCCYKDIRFARKHSWKFFWNIPCKILQEW